VNLLIPELADTGQTAAWNLTDLAEAAIGNKDFVLTSPGNAACVSAGGG